MKLIDLIAKSVKDFDSLSPQEQDDMRHEQRRSFARGMCPHNRDYDEWCREVDRQIPPRPKRAHKVMTPEEYAATPINGWHEVCRNVDGFGGVGVRYVTD